MFDWIFDLITCQRLSTMSKWWLAASDWLISTQEFVDVTTSLSIVITIFRLIIWNDYSIWYFFINYSMTLLMWWRHFNIDAVNELQILQSLVVTICRLFIWIVFFTSSIFSSLTDINMSLIFFVDRLWLLEEMLSCEWKFYTITFLITQRSNIVWTALNWDLLTLLTFIWTQNRIKRFVVNIIYRWISLSAHII